MSNSPAKAQKKHKYPLREVVVNGKVRLIRTTRMGNTEKFRPSLDLIWHHYLDKLTWNPLASHPFEFDSFRSNPELWGLLCSLGYVHNDRLMTRNELWAARDSYIERLEMGEAPYSSNLITTEWLVPQQQN